MTETAVGPTLEIVFALALIILLIVGAGWLMRRFSGVGTASNGQLSIVAAIGVGTKERIAVVQIGKRQIVVGITPQQINLLLELDQPIEPKGENGEFARKLQSLMKKPAQETHSGESTESKQTDGQRNHASAGSHTTGRSQSGSTD